MRSLPRDLRALIAFSFAASGADATVVTLLPSIRRDLGLAGVEAGAVLSATTLVMLAAAVPLGLIAGRVGSKRLLTVAGVLVPLAMIGMAVAPGLPALLAARAVFGLSFGILWVIGPVRAAASGRSARGVGFLIGAAGAGWLVAPIVSGIVADAVGWRWPLFGFAVVALPVAVSLARDRAQVAPASPLRLRDAFTVVRSERAVVGALLASAVLGVVSGSGSLLIPEVLSGNGLSASGIGLVLALSALLWTLAGPLSGRAAAAGVDVRLAGVALGVLAIAYLVPAVSLSTGAIVFFVLISAAFRAAANTLAYALGAGTSAGESSATAVIALMNAAWASTALVSPLLVGAVESDAAIRLSFALTAVLGLGVAAWMVTGRRTALPA